MITKDRLTSSVISPWPHPNCFVCSANNEHGLNLEFTPSEDGGVSASFTCSKKYEGYPGVIHGGIISSIVDGAMTNCLFIRGVVAVTADLNVRFRWPVFIDKKATVKAEVRRNDSPLYVVEARIIQEGKVRITATGKFLEKPNFFGKTTI